MNVLVTPTQAKSLLTDENEDAPPFNLNTSWTRGHLLLVDDNQFVRETLSELLELVGFHVLQANDAIEAMVTLAQVPTIDAMVTDLTMPGDNGITLIRQARLIRGDMPAILLTGYAEQVAAISTIGGNAVHVMRKPVKCQRLVAQLDELIQGSSPH